MAKLVWDKAGERIYQTGVDQGVLYLQDGSAVAWNGLTSIEENTTQELKPFYLDGVKFLETLLPGDFSGVLKAFTYPDEFEEALGVLSGSGLSYYDQPAKSFNLSYRTRVGNDIEGTDYGYKLHLLYNLFANASAQSFATLDDATKPTEFSFALTGTPQKIVGGRPTAHLSIDSRNTPSYFMDAIIRMLYGTDLIAPHFPTVSEIDSLFDQDFVIIDNGDGTWAGFDPQGDNIVMLDATTFEVDNVDAVYNDPDTYEISTTFLED